MPPLPGGRPRAEAAPDSPRADGGELRHLARHVTTLANALDQPVTPGNRVELLLEASATCRAMLQAIAAARNHINIECCLLEVPGVAQEFARRLVDRRREGVRVNLLYDGCGARGQDCEWLETLRRADVQLCEYNRPTGWQRALGSQPPSLERRKLLIVDGRIAITGGCEAAALVRAEAHAGEAWLDTHLRVEGPVVATLQRLFLDHWCSARGAAVQKARYFPPLAAAGEHQVAIAAGDAGRRRHPYGSALLRAIDSAEQAVHLLAASGPLPSRRLQRALAEAARRGVDVRVVLPGPTRADRPALQGRERALLDAGVRLFERRAELPRAALALALIDGVWATVGSGPFDGSRLLRPGADAKLVVLDHGFGEAVEAVFLQELGRSRELRAEPGSVDGWQARTLAWLTQRLGPLQ
ncbi:phospholipase D-like domain-containing protein [Aquabacterium sp. A7-Y]|uniref:phospholipase D-like domain-containing protein n=1 Tax=Aquabacterium sp. A7-Y TaxID=1349605 RepID=UPI00223D161B|nr:phospholipase D-like domain-containing protein [Aquabacterium sp. A7-Y]MCW7536328.1 phospholipase D-like domain-containing protein [Aquabacterium sp. A7-Y]